jgi:16S rRNA (cytosine967-C5)-methyltransferase
VLRAIAQRDAYANLLLPALLAERGLTGRDAALATELTYGTLRGQGSYDAVIDVCSDRPVSRIDPALRDVLRLGVHQLLATRIPAHAAVAASVDLAKDVAGARPSGFVNAILRRVATRDREAWLAIVAPSRAEDPVGYLAVTHSHPRWVVAAMCAALGEEPGGELAETELLLVADNSRPGVTLLAKPGQVGPGELATAGARPARWSPYGAYLREGYPADVPAVADGRAAVQDEASQLAAVALAGAPLTGPDRLWLDMCAGPGGKASLLAGIAAGRGARLLAADVQPHRAALARAAMAGRATGGAARVVGGAGGTGRVVVADGTSPAWRRGAFDRVLADVPCSGLGALRRRPEARWRRRPRDIAGLGALQRRLLRAALGSVRPGGVVAYVTCSPHIDETRRVVEDVLSNVGAIAGVTVLDAPAVLADMSAQGRAGLGASGPRERPRGPGQSGPGLSGPGLSGPGLSGPGLSGPGLSGPGLSGPELSIQAPGEPESGTAGPGGPALSAEGLRSPRPSGHPAGAELAGPAAGCYAQFWPHLHGTDAIFVALLRRDA